MMPGRTMTRTETIKERKRRRTTKQNTSNSSNLVEQVTPQIISWALNSCHFYGYLILSGCLFLMVHVRKNQIFSNFPSQPKNGF